MAAQNEIEVLVKAEVAGYLKNLKKADKSGETFGKRAKKRAAKLKGAYIGLAAAIGGVAIAIGKTLGAYAKQDQAERLLQKAFSKTSDNAKQLTEDFKKFAAQQQKVTKFGDEVTIAAAAQLQSLANLSGEGLQKAIKATQDLAVAQGIDLKTAALLLGKTIGSTTDALSRYIGDSGLKGVTDKGQRAEKIIAKLNSKFGGFAEEEGKAAVGTLARFTNAIGDAVEKIGESLFPVLEPLLNVIGDFASGFGRLPSSIRLVTAAAIGLTPILIGLNAALGPIGLALTVIGGAAVVFAGQMASAVTEARDLGGALDKLAGQQQEWAAASGDLSAQRNVNLERLTKELEKIKDYQFFLRGIIDEEKRLADGKGEVNQLTEDELALFLEIIKITGKDILNKERLEKLLEKEKQIRADIKKEKEGGNVVTNKSVELTDAEKKAIEGLKKAIEKLKQTAIEQGATQKQISDATVGGLEEQQEALLNLIKLLSMEAEALAEREERYKRFTDFVLDEDEKRRQSAINTANELIKSGQFSAEQILLINQALETELENIDQGIFNKKVNNISKYTGYAQKAASDIAKTFRMFNDEEISLIDQRAKKQIEALDEEKLGTEAYEKARTDLRADADKKINDLKRRQFKADKALSIINLTINGALAAMRAFTDLPFPAAVGAAASIGTLQAIQTGIVASQKFPEFRRGGITPGGPVMVGEEGPELVNLPQGSQVIPARETREIREIERGQLVVNLYGIQDINQARNELQKIEGLQAFL